MSEGSVIERLKNIVFFADLPDDVIQRLCAVVKEMDLARDEIIFEEGDKGDAMYIILSGEALILKTIDREKKEYKSLGIVSEGELFGEMALFDNQPRSATVMARTDMKILRFSSEDFQSFLLEDTKNASKVLFQLIVVLSRRLREGAREQVAVFETGKAIASCSSVEDLADRVFSIVLETAPVADSGVLAIFNKFTEELEIKASKGVIPGDVSFSINEPFLRTLRECEQFYEGNPSAEKLFKEGPFVEAKTVIGYPICSKEKFLGFLALFNNNRQNAFTFAQRNLLIGISRQIAPALENAAFHKEEHDRNRLRRVML
jgi:CRP/FNR family transcriptional regulator